MSSGCATGALTTELGLPIANMSVTVDLKVIDNPHTQTSAAGVNGKESILTIEPEGTYL